MKTPRELAEIDELTALARAPAPELSREFLGRALLQACRLDSAEAVELLIERGADPNFREYPTAWPAIHVAVEHSSLRVVKLLAEAGADLNSQVAAGWTPLHLAVDSAADAAEQTGELVDLAVLKLLLSLGANPGLRDFEGHLPADLARQWGATEIVSLLADGSSAGPHPG